MKPRCETRRPTLRTWATTEKLAHSETQVRDTILHEIAHALTPRERDGRR
jgi:hypothetical protein